LRLQILVSEDLDSLPRAIPLPPDVHPDRAVLESDTQSKHDDTYLLAGDVLITYRDHTLRADSITYDAATGDTIATGHVRLAGGDNDEEIHASHATYNIRSGLGNFYDVVGSVGLRTPGFSPAATSAAAIASPAAPANTPVKRSGYVSSNPFLFQGRLVVIPTGS
jgi:LPS-assembly protein